MRTALQKLAFMKIDYQYSSNETNLDKMFYAKEALVKKR